MPILMDAIREDLSLVIVSSIDQPTRFINRDITEGGSFIDA